MNLVSKLEALRRSDMVMRLAAFLLCLSLLLGLIAPKLEARAFAFAPPAVAAVAAAFLGACGLKVVVDGMDREGLQDAMYKLLKEFLDTELGGITIEEWLGSAWDMTVTLGKIFLGHSLADKLNAFAQWVAGKYGVGVGINPVYSDKSITFADGSTYALTIIDFDNLKDVPGTASSQSTTDSFVLGSKIEITGTSKNDYTEIIPVNGNYIRLYNDYNGSFPSFYFFSSFWSHNSWVSPFCDGISYPFFYMRTDGSLWIGYFQRNEIRIINTHYFMVLPSDITISLISGTDLSIDRAESMSYIPELEADQGLALDVGAVGTMDETTVITGVLDDVLAGELAPTMEAVKEGTVEPPAEEVPDVENLGLPALGEALTSRFPFSIPWDIAKAIRLLAAPEKAPYFEVDFLAPLADDVGGWQGSTAIVLDFSKYAIIGQLSRWTSTIGFCLALASGTKRLIWTA